MADDAARRVAMPGRPGFPEGIQDFLEWLTSVGFVIEEDLYDPAAFGNRELELSRGDCRIQLLSDRGEWTIGIRASRDALDWSHPDAWVAFLGDFPLAGDLSELDHQTHFIKTRLDEIEALAAKPGTIDKVVEIGHDYVEWRFGIRSPRT
jgi:hypothetical protein